MNMKNRIAKSVTCGLLALTLAAGPAALWAQDYRGELGAGVSNRDQSDSMLLDTLVVRPLMLATTIVGIGLWAVSLPFSIPGGNYNEVGKEFIYKPGEYTFGRPIGNWHECGLDKHPC